MNPYTQPPYPQTNAYPSLQAQSNKYPTLPTPQNHQYQHPFPAYQYSQQNQYYPQGNVQPGFSHPRNTPNHSRKPENAESLLNEARVKQLDEGLDSCFIQFYKVWLWLSIIGFAIYGARCFLMFLANATDHSMLPIQMAGLSIYYFWNVIQCIFGLLAVSQKSLTKAKLAFSLMSAFAVPAVIYAICLIVTIATHVPDPSSDTEFLWYLIMFIRLGMVTVLLLTHVLISLNGAWRVKKILQERKMVDEGFNRSDDSWRA